MGLLSAPELLANMKESPHYQTLGAGLTDRIFLLGHADGLTLNDPYPVASMREAVTVLGADTDSPLLMALLEAYFSGARDIWLVAVAPMSEYEPDLELRDAAYYTTYRDRLDTSYAILKEWDLAQITVPVDAPFNSTVDFLGPLANYCVEAFTISGEIHLGIMGTRGAIDQDTINVLVSDGRLAALGEAGKFISVFVGDGTFHLKELPFNHTSSVAVAVAAEMSQLPLDRGMTYRPIKNVINVLGADLTKEQISQLAEAGFNAVGRNIKGRRGLPFQVISFTDNTLASAGSDYWSLVQMRLVSSVSAQVRAMGKRRLGSIGFGLFKEEINNYLLDLSELNVIRSYVLDIQRDPVDTYKALVDIRIAPYFGVRELNVSVRVGPSQ